MPEGESLQHVVDRAWPALARAVDGLGADDTVLVVAHDAVHRVLLCRVLGIPLARLLTFRQAPTTLNLLEGAHVDHLEVDRQGGVSGKRVSVRVDLGARRIIKTQTYSQHNTHVTRHVPIKFV